MSDTRFWLPKATAGSTLRPLEVTWLDLQSNPVDLTGLTLSATILDVQSGATRAAVGSFEVLDGAAGHFRWFLDVEDVVAGEYRVQFVATDGAEELWSFAHGWRVL